MAFRKPLFFVSVIQDLFILWSGGWAWITTRPSSRQFKVLPRTEYRAETIWCSQVASRAFYLYTNPSWELPRTWC